MLKSDELEVVRNILNRFVPDAEIIVFGFRIHGTAKPWSDLDLAIKTNSALELKLLAEIKETFQESELPFRVDVLDWNEIAESFRKAIELVGFDFDVNSPRSPNPSYLPVQCMK